MKEPDIQPHNHVSEGFAPPCASARTTGVGLAREPREPLAAGAALSPPPTLIDDADTQAQWYHRLNREYLRTRAEGRPFENRVAAEARVAKLSVSSRYNRLHRRTKPNQRRAGASNAKLAGSGIGSALAVAMAPIDAESRFAD